MAFNIKSIITVQQVKIMQHSFS
uniref:Uncharacterized protein n=1 Tax=Arundo donax TaxID=35708 RepID=A0A0A9GIW6_ARUDO